MYRGDICLGNQVVVLNYYGPQLWSCLSSASLGLDVAELMDCWVDNVSFPILKVEQFKIGTGARCSILCTL